MTDAKTWWRPLPGLGLCAALAVLAIFIAEAPFVKQTVRFSPLLIVILLGIIIATVVKLPKEWTEGVKVAQKPVLRWAVAGLGLRLSLPELGKLGVPALGVVVICTFATVLIAFALFKAFGMGEKLSALLGVGTAVCGASAIVAADTVVQSEGKDAAVSLGIVTLWGTVGIFLYPLIGQALHLAAFPYALWAGASLHETAQVVAAASAYKVAPAIPLEGARVLVDHSINIESMATVVKLARILLLAPIVFGLGWWMRKKGESTGEAKTPLVPWFLVAFVILAGVKTYAKPIGLSDDFFKQAQLVVTFLMATGMAGVGLQTGVRDLKEAGWKPVLAGLLLWVILAIVSLVLALAVPTPLAT
jgi:uncharacterized integral membrane protein (TIGR00698 family)